MLGDERIVIVVGGLEKMFIVVMIVMRETAVSSVMDIAVAWFVSLEADTTGSKRRKNNG